MSSTRFLSVCLALLLALTFAAFPARALYEEQVGAVDWGVAHIGAVHSLINRQGVSLVGTNQNIVAAVSQNNGETVWRQMLPSGEKLITVTSFSKSRVISLSRTAAGPCLVRSWSNKDGALIWESLVFDSSNPEQLANKTNAALTAAKLRISGFDYVKQPTCSCAGFKGDLTAVPGRTEDGKTDVLAAHDNTVSLLSGADGSAVWSWSKPEFATFRVAVKDGQVAVVGRQKEGSITIYILNLNTGKEISSRSIPFAPKADKNSIQVLPSSSSMVLLNASSKSLTLIPLFDAPKKDASGKEVSLKETKMSVDSTTARAEILGAAGKKSWIAVYAGNQQVIYAIEGDALTQVQSFTTKKGEDAEYALASDDKQQLVRATLASGKFSIDLFDFGSATPAQNLVSSQPFAHRAGLKSLWVDRQSVAPQIRILVRAVDDSLSLFASGKQSWVREEALASTNRIQFVELPVGDSDLDDESTGTYPGFFTRLVGQTKELVQFATGVVNPKRLTDKIQSTISGLNATIQSTLSPSGQSALRFKPATYARTLGSDAPLLTQDYFGFRKLILTSTSNGKIFALDSEAGSIVWGRFFRPASVLSGENEEDDSVLAPWKVVVLSHHEAVAIVHEEKGNTHLIAFNPLTGDLIKDASVVVPFTVINSVVLPYTDSHGRHILLVSDPNGSVALFPKGDEVSKLVASKSTDICFFTVNAEQHVIKGFTLTKAAAAGGKTGFKGVESWSMVFPENERIVAIAARPSNEAVQSSVRILGGGDGGYLYKYLNPNLLAVATVRSSIPSERVVPSLKRGNDPSLNLYLLDTVTGATLERFVHKGCEGPVIMVLSENTLVYHYFNAAEHRYEISSVELYENKEGSSTLASTSGVQPLGGSIFDGLTVSSLAALGQSSVAPFNSFTEPSPQCLQQTFSFKSSIKFLGVTQTRRGISMKEFLVGLPSDQIYALPRMLLDPRRPVGEPTTQDKMEGLVPYSAEIPVDPLRIVSHLNVVAGLKGVVSTHALLESTSLVCAHGIDLFCIRLTPSQTFDLLNEDFNSPFLIATVTAVFAAIFFTRKWAKAKELKAAWK